MSQSSMLAITLWGLPPIHLFKTVKATTYLHVIRHSHMINRTVSISFSGFPVVFKNAHMMKSKNEQKINYFNANFRFSSWISHHQIVCVCVCVCVVNTRKSICIFTLWPPPPPQKKKKKKKKKVWWDCKLLLWCSRFIIMMLQPWNHVWL